MKTFFLTSLFFILFSTINAQEIEGTTSGGKKIMLNIDNMTWRYVNKEDGQKPCYTNATADLIIKNHTNHDIYFHYVYSKNTASEFYYYYGDVVKVQANADRKIDRVHTRKLYTPGDTKVYDFAWTVSYESYQIKWNGDYTLKGVKGFDNGTFIVYDCETEIIDIND